MIDLTDKRIWAYALAFGALSMLSKYVIPWHLLFS